MKGCTTSATVWLALGAILLVAAGFRLWRILAPPSDFPADRQITTALLIDALARGRALAEYRAYRPARGDATSNWTGVRELMPEAPLIPWLAAMTARALALSREGAFIAARAWTVLFSLATIVLTFLLGLRWLGTRAALFAAGAMAVLPATVYFGRAVIPDVPMMTLMLAAILATDNAMSRGQTKRPRSALHALRSLRLKDSVDSFSWFLVALVALALAVLAKLYGALAAVPMAWLVFANRRQIATPPVLAVVVGWCGIAIAVLAPVFLYYPVSAQAPLESLQNLSGATNSLLQNLPENLSQRAAWIAFANRLDLLLTTGGTLLALGGVAALLARGRAGALLAWLAAQTAFALAATGANTYWVFALAPPACLCMGAAFDAVAEWIVGQTREETEGRPPRPCVGLVTPSHGWESPRSVVARCAAWAAIGLALTCSLLFSPALNKVLHSYYAPDPALLRAGEFVRAHTPSSARVATCGEVPFDLLWAADRGGWSLTPESANALGGRAGASRDWSTLALYRPQTNQALFQRALLEYPCLASSGDVALFAPPRPQPPATDAAPEYLATLTPPVLFQNGLRLTGAGVEPAAPQKPTTLTVTLTWDASSVGVADPRSLVAAARWKARGPDGATTILRLPCLQNAINLPGHDFSLAQFAPAAVRLDGADYGRLLTRWTFEVPPHFPPGAYRLEAAISAAPASAEFVPIVSPGAGVVRGVWVALNMIEVAPRALAPSPEGAVGESFVPSELFFAGLADGRWPERGGAARLTGAEGDVYLDLGVAATTRVATLEFEALPLPNETLALSIATDGRGTARFFSREARSGKARGQLPSQYLAQERWLAPPGPAGAVVRLRLRPTRPPDAPLHGPVCWPLYPDEAGGGGQGALVLQRIVVSPNGAD